MPWGLLGTVYRERRFYLKLLPHSKWHAPAMEHDEERQAQIKREGCVCVCVRPP